MPWRELARLIERSSGLLQFAREEIEGRTQLREDDGSSWWIEMFCNMMDGTSIAVMGSRRYVFC